MREASTLKHGQPEQVGIDPARLELIRKRAQSWVANGDMPSLVLLIARKGVVVLEEAFGTRGPPNDEPLSADAIFPVMSVTKSFTAAAIMSLVDDGLLSLKHPITDLIPEITAPGADQVLVADLLAHTSGYDDVVVNRHVAQKGGEMLDISPSAPEQDAPTLWFIQQATDAPLSKVPGETAIYCNFGYSLLGDIVRRVSGESLAQTLESRILEPLGAKDTYMMLPRALRESQRVFRQPGNIDVPDLYPGEAPIDSEASDDTYGGALGLQSNAWGIGSFAQMLLNSGTYGDRRVLSAAAVRAMTSPQWAPGTTASYTVANPVTEELEEHTVRGGNWGYGLYLFTGDDRAEYINGTLSSPRSFGHTGALGSYFWADPEDDIVGVYLSVMPRVQSNGNPFFWRADHFQDMTHASIID